MSEQSQLVLSDPQAPTPPFENKVARWGSQKGASSFDRDRRRDVRLRLGQPAILEIAIGHRQTVTLESLSLGGLGLTGGPASWERDWPVAFTLFHKGASLSVLGRVVWRRHQTVGVAFARRSVDHDLNVHQFLSTFLADQNGGFSA